jgi:hypothetical protein
VQRERSLDAPARLAQSENQQAALHPARARNEVRAYGPCVIGTDRPLLHFSTMYDPLFVRSHLAIQENKSLREERRRLLAERDDAIYELRWAVYESAGVRTRSNARRHDREGASPLARNLRR